MNDNKVVSVHVAIVAIWCGRRVDVELDGTRLISWVASWVSRR